MRLKKINQLRHRYIRYHEYCKYPLIPYFIEEFYVVRFYKDGPAKYVDLWDYNEE